MGRGREDINCGGFDMSEFNSGMCDGDSGLSIAWKTGSNPDIPIGSVVQPI